MIVGIVEDNQDYVNILLSKLKEYGFSNKDVHYYLDTQSFKKDIKERNLEFDIILLDIELDKESGIDLALKINRLTPFTQIIYISAYIEYTSDVYQTKHTYFISKERLDEYLPLAISKAKGNIQHLRSQYLYISWNKQKYEVLQKDIVYIERKLRVSHIYTKNESYRTSLKISELGSLLNDTFCICHKSFIVHMSYVKNIEENAVRLSNDQRIPVSRSQREVFKKLYNRYLSNNE